MSHVRTFECIDEKNIVLIAADKNRYFIAWLRSINVLFGGKKKEKFIIIYQAKMAVADPPRTPPTTMLVDVSR